MPMMKSNVPASKSLLGARFFEIENLALHLGEGGQLLHRAGEEARGDIGERVGVQAALEQRQHCARQAAGAGADFEDAQSAAFGQMARGFLHRRGDRRQPVAGERGRRRKIDPANPLRLRRTAPAPHPFRRAGQLRVPNNSQRRATPQ